MEDRFKFRAWNFDNKKYYPQNEKGIFILDGELLNGTSVEVSCSVEDLVNSNNYGKKFVVEQCTGLKDKNGNLIYEGDILEVDYYNNYWKVVYQEELGKYCLDNEQGHLKGINQFLWSTFKVIGNIHENPELLEEKSK